MYRWLSEAFNLFSIIAATGIGALVARMIGGDWSTPLPWLTTAFAVSGTVGVCRVTRASIRGLRSRLHVPKPVAVPHSGETAVLEIRNTGKAGTLTAEAQIVQVFPTEPMRRTEPYQLGWRGTGGRTVSLGPGERDFLGLALFDHRQECLRLMWAGGLVPAGDYQFPWRQNDSPKIDLNVCVYDGRSRTTQFRVRLFVPRSV
jgi:hypothetical protein